MKNAFSKISSTLSAFGKSASKPVYIPPDKKGEINELKTALSDPNVDKDQNKKREILQKVIWYTTMGLDTSKLFDKMILNVNTKDVVQKKMVYQYITHYSHTNPELALMTINTLSKDCRDESPLIRGLALRSLSQLRLPKIIEHLLPLIKEGLNDPSPYVRKTAVAAVMKLNKISPAVVETEKIVDRLYTMIRDKDVQVVVNSILALEEILEGEGGLKVTKKMIEYLLNRIFEYNEWQLCVVFDLLQRYQPENSNEVLNMMNLLDDSLQIANSAIVMGITAIFLKFSDNLPKIHSKVYARLKDPLLLLYSSAAPELAYTILCHLKLMASRSPLIFAPHYKDFFIRHNDPAYLKTLKLEVLTIVATDQTVSEIMDEISFYVTISDNDVETSKKAIRAIGEIAVKLSIATEASLTYLLEFMEMDVPHILSETFVVLKDILRKYNNQDFCKTYLPQITKHWRTIEDSKALVAFLWILGEFAIIIQPAPYILETFIDQFTTYHYTVRLEILSTALKLFFKRPPEMQKMLGRLFETAISDASHADVHDRALFYYRLLSTDLDMARQVVAAPKGVITTFSEEESAEFRDKMFLEFNTLSVIFNKPSERFIITGPGVLGEEEEEEEEGGNVEEDEAEEEEEEEEQPQQKQMEQRLLSTDDDDQDEDGGQTNQGGMLEFFGSPTSTPQGPSMHLASNPKPLIPALYQEKWQTSQAVKPFGFQLKQKPDPRLVEQTLKDNKVACIASQKQNEPAMFYLYAMKDKVEEYFLVECKIFANGSVTCVVKNDKSNPSELELFTTVFRNIFKPFM